MPAVTILIPTFERPRLLEEALASALNQTHRDVVVLIGDSSETDDTQEVVRRIDDPRITYVRNPSKMGPQDNWLQLVAKAETDLVATLHDDDRWHPEFLARTLPHMVDEPEIGMTFTDFWAMDAEGHRLVEHSERESERTHRSTIPAGRLDYSLVDGLRMVAVWGTVRAALAAVLRRDVVLATEFPPEMSPLYDIWLCYQLVMKGVGLAYEPQRLTSWRIHADSLSGLGYAGAEDNVYRQMLDDNWALGPVAEEIERTWGRLQWSRGMHLMSASGTRVRSQAELMGASQHLTGPRRLAARTGASHPLGWHGLRLARSAVHRLADRTDPRFRAAR